MPTFDTAKPINASVTIESGTVRIIAGDRAETVVDVRPTSETRAADVRAAERTRVEYTTGRLLVKGPKERSLFGRGSSVDVEVMLPEGSDVHVTTSMADCTVEGRLGECEVKTSMGEIRVVRAASVRLDTGHGRVYVDRTDGQADVTTASGEVRLGTIGGAAVVKNSNGSTEIGEVVGELRVRSANGAIVVTRARADVTARTATGAIEIGEVTRGTAVLETGTGRVDIGISEGTAAWLDVQTKYGSVRQSLGSSAGPGDSGETVKVRARTGLGDIVIHRA
ncbi:hypothetical protein C9F11_28760 [Streptomyces sp. YIM 121038]|uniref:DUF4097 family beta strand repeat-containing protein n=1 Tax=Streptomyces sp. YIM 121038 TaxID=2136401 RepID=UPI00111074F2|nr:DUF4097 family beta strand repeat-containing protein [Streptomyces sp. YIM 121038]QCX79352.1 hypothetical protein C9F11_28760 [Streptomyces sp. YIM 121038]